MTKMSVSAKSLAVFVLITIYTVIYGFWVGTIDPSTVDNYAKLLFPWVISAILIQLICFLFIKKVNMFDIGLWFLVLSYFFMYGFLFIDFFEMEISLLWTPIREYDQSVLFKAASFVNLSLNMFSLGYLLRYKTEKRTVAYDPDSTAVNERKFKIGIILCIVGGVCQLITSWNLIRVTQEAGSYTAYTEAASSGLIDDIAFLFVPGIIYVLASKKLTVGKAFALTGATALFFSVIMLLSGSRKTQIFAIVAVILAYMFIYKPKKFKLYHKALLVVGGVLFLNMIYVIRENRFELTNMIPNFLKSLSNLDFLKVLLPEVLAETGITFCSIAAVIYCVPSVFSFQYGTTFLRSVLSILPIGWLFPDFFNKATTTMTINVYLDRPVGGSMFADFFWNFGNFGIIAMFLFGIILSSIYVKLRKRSCEIYFSVFYIMMIGVRAGIFELVRPLFVVIFLPWFLNLVFAELKKQRA